MKIIIFASNDKSFLNFRKELILEIIKKKHTLHCVAPKIGEKTKNFFSQNKITYSTYSLRNNSLNFIRDFKVIYQITKIIIKNKPNLIFAYTLKPVVFGSFVSRFFRNLECHSLFTGLGYLFINNSIKIKFIRFVLSYVMKFSLIKNKSIIFQNKDDYKLIKRLLNFKNENIFKIIEGSGVNTSFYYQHSIPIEKKFLMIARIIKDKGIFEYINASKLIKKKYPNTTCSIAGWFDENPSAINRQDFYNKIKGKIKFFENVNDIREIIKNHSIVVLPSYREGLPRSLLESMSMCRPIITTNVPGCKSTVIENYNGLLVEPKNYLDLYAAMEKMIKFDELKKMGLNSRKLVIDKFEMNLINSQFTSLMNL